MSNTTDLAIAGAAVSLVLIDNLVRKGVLSRGDGMLVLETAAKRCEAHSPAAAQMCRDAESQMRSGH